MITFLSMVPVHNEDHVGGTEILAKVNEVHESGLRELVNRDIAHPNEELLCGIVIHAREFPARLSSTYADS
jgi:hypothetical protein